MIQPAHSCQYQNVFESLKETAHQQEVVTHPQASLSLDIIYTMASIGQEQDHRSVLEYVDLYTIFPTHVHSKYIFTYLL